MSAFRVGDVVVAVGLTENPSRNGMEGTVYGIQNDWPVVGAISRRFYRIPLAIQVHWADGDKTAQWPDQLRLKRPPSWDAWIYDTSAVDSESKVSA